MNVPAGLVMRTDPPDHSVLVASKGEGNPYGVGTSFVLNRKLSCHSVLKNRDELLVRDAYSDPEWCDQTAL